MDSRVWEWRLPGLLGGLRHFLSHTNQFFDKKFEHGVFVADFHLRQFLKFSDLNHIWILLHLLLLNNSLLLSKEHLLMPDDFFVLGFEHLPVFCLLLVHGILDDLQRLHFLLSSLHRHSFLKVCMLWHRRHFLLEDHRRWAIRFIQKRSH